MGNSSGGASCATMESENESLVTGRQASMATLSLEERVAALEDEVAQLKTKMGKEQSSDALPWWERIFGAFRDDPLYEEAMALGRAYRGALRPPDEEATAG